LRLQPESNCKRKRFWAKLPFRTRGESETQAVPGKAAAGNSNRVRNSSVAQKRTRLQLESPCKRQRFWAKLSFLTQVVFETRGGPSKAAVCNSSRVRNGSFAQKHVRLQLESNCKRKRFWAKLPFRTRGESETQAVPGKAAVGNSNRVRNSSVAQKRSRLQLESPCKRQRFWAKLSFLTQVVFETQGGPSKAAVCNSSRVRNGSFAQKHVRLQLELS
jgi:hypothetical protein